MLIFVNWFQDYLQIYYVNCSWHDVCKRNIYIIDIKIWYIIIITIVSSFTFYFESGVEPRRMAEFWPKEKIRNMLNGHLNGIWWEDTELICVYVSEVGAERYLNKNLLCVRKGIWRCNFKFFIIIYDWTTICLNW